LAANGTDKPLCVAFEARCFPRVPVGRAHRTRADQLAAMPAQRDPLPCDLVARIAVLELGERGFGDAGHAADAEKMSPPAAMGARALAPPVFPTPECGRAQETPASLLRARRPVLPKRFTDPAVGRHDLRADRFVTTGKSPLRADLAFTGVCKCKSLIKR